MALLRFLAVLTPVCCVLPTDRDLSPPITNLRLDRGTKRLTWDLGGNVSSIKCYENGAYFSPARNDRYCQLHELPQCEPLNYTVLVTVPHGKPFSAWIHYPSQEGNPRAAPQDLQCRVHDLHFLTCRWAVGAEAPGDVQYEFYLEHLGTTQKWPCPRYTKTEAGTHVQCQFENVSQIPTVGGLNDLFRFLVQGASRDARIPCSEIFKSLPKMEEFVAPNLTATCNESLAVLRWKMFSHFTKTFDYELKIQKDSGDPITENLSEESWRLPNPGTFTVTVRVQGGLWSAPQRFVCDQEDETRFYVWLIALATLLAVGAAILLCKKYSVPQKLFPPIPHMKDPIGNNRVQEKMMAWQDGTPAPEDCPVAEVQLVTGT